MTITRRGMLTGGAALAFVPKAHSQTKPRPALRIAVAEVPPTLEPARELSNVGTRVTYSMFDTLIRRDFLGSPDGGGAGLKPHLATSWTRNGSDELVLKLREDVLFHNGDCLTADDVVYTFTSQRMFGDKPLMPEARSYFATLASVDSPSRSPARSAAWRSSTLQAALLRPRPTRQNARHLKQLLDAWEDEAPGTVLYQPAEFYALKRSIAWRPYTFYFMDLRNDNLAFD